MSIVRIFIWREVAGLFFSTYLINDAMRAHGKPNHAKSHYVIYVKPDSERVVCGMEGVQHLGTKYGQYCYLMAIDTEEFVYSFMEAAPALTDAEYFAKVRELHQASVAIGTCSLKSELFKLVRVDTSEATKVHDQHAAWNIFVCILNHPDMLHGRSVHVDSCRSTHKNYNCALTSSL